MSNLRDLIYLQIERGNLSEPFTVKEVRESLAGTGAPKDLNSYLANHSTGPGSRIGESVRRGQKKLFIKHKQRATYSLDYSTYKIESDTAPSVGGGTSGLPPAPPRVTGSSAGGGTSGLPPAPPHVTGSSAAKNRIAQAFVDYIREKPYRRLSTRFGARGTTLVWGPGPVIGWNNRLKQYEWNGADWPTTKKGLAAFTADLKSLETNWRSKINIDRPARVVYDKIKKWGNPRGAAYTGPQLTGFLDDLWSGRTIGQVDSTLTKLYAVAKPDEYAIYDSRVAAAIMTIAEDIYRIKTTGNRLVNTVVPCFRKHYPHLGLYNGTGGTRQRGYRTDSRWPNAYGSVPAQLDANDLCVKIRDCLNTSGKDTRSNWTLREVEAVLFMEGY